MVHLHLLCNIYIIKSLYKGNSLLFVLVILANKALKLVALAEEYQLKTLKELCCQVLTKHDKPSLELVTVAQRYNYESLLTKAIRDCARQLPAHNYRGMIPSPSSIEHELTLPENKDLSKDNLIRIYR